MTYEGSAINRLKTFAISVHLAVYNAENCTLQLHPICSHYQTGASQAVGALSCGDPSRVTVVMLEHHRDCQLPPKQGSSLQQQRGPTKMPPSTLLWTVDAL
ncbi:uncharacterized protein LOC128251216 [Octopus bimaculoides]|uniref:uncharacterized protein LOC128251216 n=1 Tax=Octopus bimaculoides TaxID=37653 RepID=UPI0022E17D6C|nr:uncharacterized protein LOC128251216 [Octopus bimaculoides]